MVWQKQFTGFSTEENKRQGLADHRFALTPAQYVRIAWKYWDSACATGLEGSSVSLAQGCSARGTTAELQVYGTGYPLVVRLRSPLVDLGSDKIVNAIRFRADTPPGTRLEVRSRTGIELIHQVAYHDKNGKEVTQKRWEKLVPSFRGPVDTTAAAGRHRSPWSPPYLLSGEVFQSPSPRRYLELEARLISATPG